MKIKYLFISFVIICNTNYSGPKRAARKAKQQAAKLDAVQEHFSTVIGTAEAHLADNMKPMLLLFNFIKSRNPGGFKEIIDSNRPLFNQNIDYSKKFLSSLEKMEIGLASGYFEKPDAKSRDIIMPEMRLLFLDRIKGLKSELNESVIQAETQIA